MVTSETRFQELLRYVRLDAADAKRLLQFGDLARPDWPRVAAAFYDRIREHEPAHAVITSEEQIERLQATLIEWLDRVCSGSYDEPYREQTAKIGRVHVRIGLPQRYMFTAMAVVRVELLRIADRELGADAGPTREAIVRILDLELAVMLEAYEAAFVERIQQAARPDARAFFAAAPQDRLSVDPIELASVLIVGIDTRGCIQLFNREAELVTGYARDEVIGKEFADALCAGVETAALQATFAEALADTANPHLVQARLLTRAGKVREIAWSVRAAVSPAGGVLWATGRDVTDERVREERAGQHRRLAAVGTLAAGLAHEIRNPLNGALVHVAFLERAIQRDSTKQAMLEATGVVADEIKRLANLVTQFLDFARPSRPAFQLTSVSKWLTETCERVATSAEAKGVAISCDLPSVDLQFEADATMLSQALLNLLDNAIEAGSKSVRLRARRGPHEVLIDVEDDGRGLPALDAPIFDAFYSTKEGGTGLGLAIAHRVVTDHRGTIDVTSRPGRTTFHVALPLEQIAGEAR
jgi:PAS domain S-box-containing protein